MQMRYDVAVKAMKALAKYLDCDPRVYDPRSILNSCRDLVEELTKIEDQCQRDGKAAKINRTALSAMAEWERKYNQFAEHRAELDGFLKENRAAIEQTAKSLTALVELQKSHARINRQLSAIQDLLEQHRETAAPAGSGTSGA